MSEFSKKHKISPVAKSKYSIEGKFSTAYIPKKRRGFKQQWRRFRKFFWRFRYKKRKWSELSGRVNILHLQSNQLLQKMEKINKNLETLLDDKNQSYLKEIVAPLLKEYASIQKMLSKDASLAQQAKVSNRYHKWIEQAKEWINMCEEAQDQQEVVKGMIKKMTGTSTVLIDRDLQVLKEYRSHLFQTYPLNTSLERRVQLEQELFPHLENLKNLKEPPATLTLDRVAAWKLEIDQNRESCFEKALQTIDSFIAEIALSKPNHEERKHLDGVLKNITDLEKRVANLQNKCENNALSPRLRRQLLKKNTSLQKEAHLLNSDLALSDALSKRIERLMGLLAQLEEKLDMG